VPDAPQSPVPHLFPFFLANRWETTNLNRNPFTRSNLTRIASFVCNEQIQVWGQSRDPADLLTRNLREAEADLLNVTKSQPLHFFVHGERSTAKSKAYPARSRREPASSNPVARIGTLNRPALQEQAKRSMASARLYLRYMFPYLHIWHFQLNSFGLMLWLASVAAAFVMDRNFKRAGINSDAVGMVAVAALLGIVGAKLWHVIDTPVEFREYGWRVLWDTAGFAWFGGLLFGISALAFQGWWAKIGILKTLDLASPAAAIGYGIGRIGCFLSGDGCYGIPTTLPWGMSFPNGIEPTFARVHPTPLYELGAGLVVGLWLWLRGGKPHGTGSIVGQYLVLTGIARFLVEFVRRNPKIIWGLSNAQLASLGSVLAGAALVWWAARRPVIDPDAAAVVEKAA